MVGHTLVGAHELGSSTPASETFQREFKPATLSTALWKRAVAHCSAGVLLIALFVLPATVPALATCVDPTTLVHSTVSITKYFSNDSGKAENAVPDVLGVRGTAWFSSPASMITVEHVAAAMDLSTERWEQVEILDGADKRAINVRLMRVVGSQSEKIAILELQTPLPAVKALTMRLEPLAADEEVVALGYPGNRQRFVGGRFVGYGNFDKLEGAALLEIFDGDNRLALDHGASGAPVLDCKGRVVAVVSNIFTQTLQFPFRAIRVSTAWGQANVASIPIQALSGIAPAK